MAEIEFPEAFAQRMQMQLQEEWQNFVSAHQLPSPTSIRINPKKNSVKEFEKIPWTNFGYYLEERPSFTFDPLFHAGAYYVQEASSMFLEQALKQSIDLYEPLWVLDLCAAPGGKSTHLLSLLKNQSLVVANETIRTRATILAENICKWGNINAIVTNNDPEDFQKLNGFFDVILVDAPCSGEGLFRKDPEAMIEWSEENATLCSSRQQRILNQAWGALKQNGILIYSTCTYNPGENEINLAQLIKGKKAESLKLNLPRESNWGVEEVLVENVFGYHFYPHKTKGEGFFASVLKKIEHEEEVSIRTKRSFDYPYKKITERLSPWFKNQNEIEFISHDDLVLAVPKESIQEIEFLSKNLRVIQKGTAVATIKNDKFIPEHAFALSNEINAEHFPSMELTHEQAITYLRKDVLNLNSDKTGFTLMKYQNVPIGWVNHLGNRTNNLYPSNWRIRSEP